MQGNGDVARLTATSRANGGTMRWLALVLIVAATFIQFADKSKLQPAPQPEPACEAATADMERAVLSKIGVSESCPSFPTPSPGYNVPREAAAYLGLSGSEGCGIVMKRIEDAARARYTTRDGLCEQATIRRNFGIGQTADDVVRAAALGALKATDELLGAWLDPTHMCGLVMLVAQPKTSLEMITVCKDGTVISPDRMVSMKPPPGAKRAWHSPGLKMKVVRVLGTRTVEWLDGDGESHDYHRLVERQDGSVTLYESGVGSDPENPIKPVISAQPYRVK